MCQACEFKVAALNNKEMTYDIETTNFSTNKKFVYRDYGFLGYSRIELEIKNFFRSFNETKY